MSRELTIGLGAGVVAGLLVAVGVFAGVDVLPLAATVAVLGVIIGCGVLAIHRFAWLILLLLAIRPELDAVRAAGDSPATAVGLIFIAACGWWLLSRYRTGRLHPPSAATWGLVGLTAAAGLSALASHAVVVSMVATTRLASGVLMFVVLEQLVRAGLLPVRHIVRAVGVSAVLVCGHVALQALTGTAPLDESTGLHRVTGPFVHPSVLGKYAAVVALIMLARIIWCRDRERWLWALAALACTAVAVLTYTRAAWIALTLGGLIITARYSWRRLPALVGAVLALVVVVPTLGDRVSDLWAQKEPVPGVPDNSMAWRLDYWQDLMPLSRINPFSGIGLDVVPVMRSEGLLPHNVWVQAWVELGALGVVALCGAVVMITVSLVRAARAVQAPMGEERACLEAAIAVALGLLVMSLTENLLGETTTLWYAAAAMAVGWSVGRTPRGHEASGTIPRASAAPPG